MAGQGTESALVLIGTGIYPHRTDPVVYEQFLYNGHSVGGINGRNGNFTASVNHEKWRLFGDGRRKRCYAIDFAGEFYVDLPMDGAI